MKWPRYRSLTVPTQATGMRLDRLLTRFFHDRSRSSLAAAIKRGEVCTAQGKVLRSSYRVSEGDVFHLYIPGIAPTEPPPPLPPILFEDEHLLAVDKPSGMLAHPAGTQFAWALVSVAKLHYPNENMDLVHRLDRDTSGVVLLTKHTEANRALKAMFKKGEAAKQYVAITKGQIPWQHEHLRGPIGKAGGPIRIQMAVTEDGLVAHTEVTVLKRRPAMTMVRCDLHTGRTHQIRVHLDHAGFPLLGDRMYGVPPWVFLQTLEGPLTPEGRAAAGAPRQALHAQHLRCAHPMGGQLEVQAPVPEDLIRWWEHPGCLPAGASARSL